MQVAIVCPLFIPSENNVALISEAVLKTCPTVNEKFSKSKEKNPIWRLQRAL